MKGPRTKNVIPFATGILSAALMLASVVNEDTGGVALAMQTNKQAAQDKDEKIKMPVAEFSVSLPDDPAEQARRIARSNRYDNRQTVRFDQWSPTATGWSSISEWYLYIAALPTAESDAVVLGKVIDAKGYLSRDKTGAYSEFTVLIDEVFKFSDSSLVPGVSIIAEREGASVRLPDGRVIRYEIAYQGMPQVGREYVLFLKYEPQGADYRLITGYEVRKGLVLPLDEADHFATYKNSSAKTFFNELREALVHPPKAPRGKEF
jgi:hypothetical protein